MYIKDGIAYAGEPLKPLKVQEIRPLPEYKLWIRFSTEEIKIFDFMPLLQKPAFVPLNDIQIFNGVSLEFGCPVWNCGEIDIAPEYLYEHSCAM